MERTVYSSRRLEIVVSVIPGLGFALGYEHKYREVVLIFGCFLISMEFHQRKTKKRK